jgi:flavin reductase (DIM6/NTAB) family NADH-FMN oxidoreductase RutF
MPDKVSLPLGPPGGLPKEQVREWYRERNFLPSPVILVTTVDAEGTPNAAIKTNVMTVSSMRRYAFCCSPDHHTHQNIMATGQFVINLPRVSIAKQVLGLALATERRAAAGANEIEAAGLTPLPSEMVDPPRISECAAHYECLLDWHREGMITGKVVAVSVDPSLLSGPSLGLMVVGIGAADSYGIISRAEQW